MSLFITSLNSGSNGNCYYIGNDREAILVDAGISCKETEKRMRRLGLSMDKIKAIFISHEHTDHIKGVQVISKKYQLPVYITNDTLLNGGLTLNEQHVLSFQAYVPVQIGDISVTAFPKFHDAAEPHSFIVACNEIKIGVFTDIGAPCEHLIKHFQQCHAAFLEANYDEQMLEQGRYPYYLKKRIRGGHGHLSNTQALELFRTHKPAFMSHLLLSHLSKDNNNPELVLNLFNQHAGDTKIIVASRHEETEVYYISQTTPPVVKIKPLQLSMFN
ncbi:MBL fold metallo-hydrolase [Chitinophaga oryziterrae]|uniref:MBL fold metallo-hydrolase n=1 Tax=Chitinophaga oryziterrae TaxID=1031224 RepID=A0A6N8J558_9BACT|nr:MBL fold metallo-hydrolase [Chitinophaga oryziterrae]MVT40395.1 MBL fold metallo-hydrolase [Chitinophaga oryziterrae]